MVQRLKTRVQRMAKEGKLVADRPRRMDLYVRVGYGEYIHSISV